MLYQKSDRFSVSAKSLFNDHGKFLNSQLDSQLSFQNIQLDGIYEFVDSMQDERLADDIEYIRLASSYNGFEQLYFSVAGRYDLLENSIASSSSEINLEIPLGLWNYHVSQTFESEEPNKTKIAAVYEDECTRASISLENKNIKSGSSKSIQTLSFLIQFKPFGSFSVSGL